MALKYGPLHHPIYWSGIDKCYMPRYLAKILMGSATDQTTHSSLYLLHHTTDMLMAYFKTVVTPLLMQWRDHSLTQSHRCSLSFNTLVLYIITCHKQIYAASIGSNSRPVLAHYDIRLDVPYIILISGPRILKSLWISNHNYDILFADLYQIHTLCSWNPHNFVPCLFWKAVLYIVDFDLQGRSSL